MNGGPVRALRHLINAPNRQSLARLMQTAIRSLSQSPVAVALDGHRDVTP